MLRLPPQHKTHATLRQPLQCVSQHQVANLHVYTHMATPDDSNHAAIPLRSAATDSKTPYNYAHTHKHTQSSLKPPLQWGQKKGKPTAAPPAFHRWLQPLHTEKHKVSFSGFLPNTKPMQHSCSHYNAFRSITSQTCTSIRTWQRQMTAIMQPFHCDLQPQIPKHPTTTHSHTSTPKAA